MTDSWCFARRCRATLPLPPHPPAQPLWAFWGRCSLATSRWRPVYPLPWWPHSLTPGTSPLRGEHIITTAKSLSAIKILDHKGIISLYFGFTVKLMVWASIFGISFIIKCVILDSPLSARHVGLLVTCPDVSAGIKQAFLAGGVRKQRWWTGMNQRYGLYHCKSHSKCLADNIILDKEKIT